MTIRPYRLSDADRTVGEVYERTRRLERLSSGIWIYVGSGDPLPDGPDLDGTMTAPPFLNGWHNSGGGLQAMRFRWVQGGGIDLQGSVTGGGASTAIFKLPNSPLFLPDQDEVRTTASDDSGNLVVVRIVPAGFVYGGI